MTNWHNRFIDLSHYISSWSKDPSTKVGALIVDSDNNVRTIGYNGFPRGAVDSQERLSNRDLKYPLTVHAELNALMTCARLGIRTEGCYIICTNMPCTTCCGAIIQAGIKKVIITAPSEDMLSRWKESMDLSKTLLEEVGIELIIIKDES